MTVDELFESLKSDQIYKQDNVTVSLNQDGTYITRYNSGDYVADCSAQWMRAYTQNLDTDSTMILNAAKGIKQLIRGKTPEEIQNILSTISELAARCNKQDDDIAEKLAKKNAEMKKMRLENKIWNLDTIRDLLCANKIDTASFHLPKDDKSFEWNYEIKNHKFIKSVGVRRQTNGEIEVRLQALTKTRDPKILKDFFLTVMTDVASEIKIHINWAKTYDDEQAAADAVSSIWEAAKHRIEQKFNVDSSGVYDYFNNMVDLKKAIKALTDLETAYEMMLKEVKEFSEKLVSDEFLNTYLRMKNEADAHLRQCSDFLDKSVTRTIKKCETLVESF